jgi:cephalosporin hydroxylase
MQGGSFSRPESSPPLSPAEREVVAAFTRLYYSRWYHDRTGGSGSVSIGWLGHLIQKAPTDLWACQEIITAVRPDIIIETGSCLGGSALFMAMLCELLGQGEVISIDITRPATLPAHPRLTFLTGDSASPAMRAAVEARLRPGDRVMVILDADHGRDHVAAELALWADLVTEGSYLIVEDTAVNGHPVLPEHGPGPMEALDAFLAGRDDFVVDTAAERFLLSLSPRGYLRRRRA